MSTALQAHFEDYAAHHQTPGNKATHLVGIPLIVLTTLSLLGRVSLFELAGVAVSAAELVIVAAGAYYLSLDRGLGLQMLLVVVALDLIGRWIPWPVALGIFVGGWVLQFLGHAIYERRSPAFLHNLIHLLIGPLWILARVTGRA